MCHFFLLARVKCKYSLGSNAPSSRLSGSLAQLISQASRIFLWCQLLGTLRYGDYGLRTTVERKIFFCVVLGRVHNDWRENTKLRSQTTHTGLRTIARCKNTAACVCFFFYILRPKCLLLRFKMLWFTH